MEAVAAGVEVGVGDGWVDCEVGGITLFSVPPPLLPSSSPPPLLPFSLLPSSSPSHDVDCMHTLCCLFQLAEGQDEAERKHMSVDDVSKLIEELARIH